MPIKEALNRLRQQSKVRCPGTGRGARWAKRGNKG